MIVRPSPYICAEWEFGGLPAWLLREDGMRLRVSYGPFLRHVEEYYKVLLPKLTPCPELRAHQRPALRVLAQHPEALLGPGAEVPCGQGARKLPSVQALRETEKYRRYREVIGKYAVLPEMEFSTEIRRKSYGTLEVCEKVSI